MTLPSPVDAPFDRSEAFADIGDLLLDVDCELGERDRFLLELATAACRYVTGAQDPDDVPDFVAACRGEHGAIERIAAAEPRLDYARYADMDPTGVFGDIAPRRHGIARLVMARRMAVALDRSYARAFPALADLEGEDA